MSGSLVGVVEGAGLVLALKHTDIRASLSDAPSGELYRTERRRITLESERIDAVIAKIYNLSRADAQALIKRALVYVGGTQIGRAHV